MLNKVLWEDFTRLKDNSGSLSGARDRCVSCLLWNMICGHPFTQQLWVDIGHWLFFCCVGWGKMGLLAARGGGGRLWRSPAPCVMAPASLRRHFFWEPNWRRSTVTFWQVGTEMYSSCLRASAESESSDCWQELTEEREAGNHKPLIDSLSFLQPIPSTNHIWKYSFQASFTMAKKKKFLAPERIVLPALFFSGFEFSIDVN